MVYTKIGVAVWSLLNRDRSDICLATYGFVWIDTLLLNHLPIRCTLYQLGCLLCVTTNTDMESTSSRNDSRYQIEEWDLNE